NCPIPRRGTDGAGSMFVRSLIAEPPALRTSGASEVLVPPPANPQTAQSSVPTEVRLTDVVAGGSLDTATLPCRSPAAVTVAQFENSDVLPSGAMAVIVTLLPGASAVPSVIVKVWFG